MLVALGFGLVAVVLSSIPNKGAAASGSAPVTVVNTPLPVQGTVDVSQNGSWNVAASQNGVWSVGVNNTPNVSVTNTPTVDAQQMGSWNVGITGNTSENPLFTQDVDQPGRHPYRDSCGQAIPTGTISAQCFLATVPAGKELVVEMVSISTFTNGAQVVNQGLEDNMLFTQLFPNDFFLTSQLVRMYFAPGQAPSCYSNFNGGGSVGVTGAFNCVIHGYLISK